MAVQQAHVERRASDDPRSLRRDDLEIVARRAVEILTTSEVHEMLQARLSRAPSLRTVYRIVVEELDGFRIGGAWFTTPERVERWLEERVGRTG